jgi:DNA-directed RNA polymerase subunit E'/Rpb7
MEQTVLFEQKVTLTPKDMNRMGTDSINNIILENVSKNLEGRCNQHGYIIQNSLEILSRSMGQLEHGRYTGNIVFHVQLQGKVYNPVNGTRITGKIDKKNKMGLYIIYNDAIRILIPRDLHIGNKTFEELEPGQEITVEIRKSRFQVQDLFILSIGVLISDENTIEKNKSYPFTPDMKAEENKNKLVNNFASPLPIFDNQASSLPENNTETPPPTRVPDSGNQA